MRKCICLFLVLLAMLPFAGCNDRESRESSAAFYYKRAEFDHGASDSIIASESRQINGRHADLTYVLNLYLRGPSEDTLVSPFPANIRLIGVNEDAGSLEIVLSNALLSLSDVERTIACTCMAKTCMDLAQVDTVTICTELPVHLDGFSVTMSAGDWVMDDDSASIIRSTESSTISD